MRYQTLSVYLMNLTKREVTNMPRIKSGEVSKSRLFKIACTDDKYIVRISRTTLLNLGAPTCPICNTKLKEVK